MTPEKQHILSEVERHIAIRLKREPYVNDRTIERWREQWLVEELVKARSEAVAARDALADAGVLVDEDAAAFCEKLAREENMPCGLVETPRLEELRQEILQRRGDKCVTVLK